jgi:hypothetical protein
MQPNLDKIIQWVKATSAKIDHKNGGKKQKKKRKKTDLDAAASS